TYGWIEDEGPKFGNLIVRNHCSEPLWVFSVGAHTFSGYRTYDQGYGTKEDDVGHRIGTGENYTEAYRINPPDVSRFEKEKYCYPWDKAAGQGIAVKVSKTEAIAPDILQFEYALVKDPRRRDTFYRMNYDISLLDCASVANATDVSGTTAQHDDKVAKCPGYNNGVAVTFDADPEAKMCTPVYCDGQEKCPMIYTWDRTRENEMSLACNGPYTGNMIVDLC
ncbi:hypothetical protein K504DRAFT_335360, partial [Pleomassaria siparia CBS 279.74]